MALSVILASGFINPTVVVAHPLIFGIAVLQAILWDHFNHGRP